MTLAALLTRYQLSNLKGGPLYLLTEVLDEILGRVEHPPNERVGFL